MSTASRSKRVAVVWLTAVLMALGAPAVVLSQCLQNEVIKSVKLTSPQAFNQAQPFRTNRAQINIGFEHDGASGSYLIRTQGADVDGSTFLPLPTDKSGNVQAGFNTDGLKQVGVNILQQKCNVSVDSRQTGGQNGTAFIQFDTKPPAITVQTVTLGPPPATPTPFSGQTFTTNVDQATITGTAIDPDNGSPAPDIKITVTNLANNQSQVIQLDPTSGQFNAQVTLASLADGPIDITLVAEDKMTDPNTPANKSQATTIKFVRDKTAPKVQALDIIRFDQDATRRQVLTPGAKTFVGQEIVLLRVTMSEKMASPPQVNVTQNAGTAIPATLLADRTVNDTVFFYQYNSIPVEAQNGPARVEIRGAFDGNGPNPDFGFDLANNPIAQNDPTATFAQAFSVDSVSPDLLRLPTPPPPGQFASQPADGQVIGRDAFPRVIQVFVNDFNTSARTDTNTNFASGVDFTNVSNSETPPQTGGLTIALRGPAGDIPGTPSVSPPTGLFLNLPDFTGGANNNANFTDRDGDGVKEPLDGQYIITVNLIDKVGNRATKTVSFRVDTVPVSAESIAINLSGCLRIPSGEFPPIVVSSRDPDFNVTASTVEFFSQIGGPNSVPVKFDTDAPVRAAPATPGASATITINNVRKPGQQPGTDQFPNPNPPPPTPFVPPGTIDPRTGANDGTYFVRVTPKDVAGNSGTVSTTNGSRRAFLDFPVQLDNTDPFVERTFPLPNLPISGPLNFLETVVVDPAATNGNAGCGIDVNATQMSARIEVAYQPNRVVSSFVETPGTIPSKLRGTIKFIHIPNSTDPTRNDFNPKDDRFRVALEFTDPVTGRTRTLPTDGSMDGIYSITVNPVDRAGNDLGSSVPRGDYFGLQKSPEATIDLTQFFFLVDNVPPKLELPTWFIEGGTTTGAIGRLPGANGKSKTDSAPQMAGSTNPGVIGARALHIEGFASDLSAQLGTNVGGTNSVHRGGADVDRVEYFLEVVDNQGQPIPAVAPQPDPNKEGNIIPGRPNPIIPVTQASLDPVADPANDATRSTTRPLDTGFAGTLRERRKFVIDDVLPPENQLIRPRDNTDDFYQLTVRAVDRAGNVTTKKTRVVVDVNDVLPPALVAPAHNSFTANRVVNFSWGNRPGVRKFRFKLNFPTGAPVQTYEKIIEKDNPDDVTKNVERLTLSQQGVYTWTVASFDQVGNEGKASNPFSFTLDYTAPKILGDRATVTGDVQPTNRSGVIPLGSGNFNVRLTFTELIKRPPQVSWQPPNASTSPIELTTTTVDTGVASSVFEYQGSIPRNADPLLFDGRASLIIRNVFDLANNKLNPENELIIDGFEVDTGPAFKAQFFLNPINTNEMVLVVLASEELQQIPRLSNLGGVQLLNETMLRLARNPRTFYTTLKLGLTQGTVTMQISGTDLDGNVGRRDLSLTVTRLTPAASSLLRSPDMAFAIEVPAGAVTRDVDAYIFPPRADDVETPEVVSKVSPEPTKPASQQGLIDLGPMPDVQPAGLALNAAAALSAHVAIPRGIPADKAGIYQHVNGSWRLAARHTGGGRMAGKIEAFAPMRLMADIAPPEIVEMDPMDGEALETGRPTITATVTDAGSGVDDGGIALALDGEAVSFSWDAANGRLSFTPAQDLAPGDHSLELKVRDRAGNEAPSRKIGLVAPDQFGFRAPVLAVPNPVRSLRADFALDLTQPAATANVRVELYDASGQRIRTLTQDAPFARRGSVVWDLVDERGDAVQNGVYFFRARANSVTGSKAQSKGKVVVLR